MSIKKIIFLKFLIITLSSVLIISFLVYAWDSPSSTPPNQNVPPPINTGDKPQSKAGDLNIGGGLKYWITKVGDSFALKNDAGDVKFVIGQDGNVGIGTTTPSKALQITRAGTNESAFLNIEGTGDINAAGINLKDLDNNKLWQIVNRANEDNNLNIYRHNGTSWLKVVSMTMDGNVGIGKIDPSYKLHINGRVKFDGPGEGFGSGAGFWIEAGEKDWFIGRKKTNLRIYNKGRDRVTLEPDGDIIFEIGN